ncbi:hypothetical protein GEMRC1_008983 [Eukaryota sp. GEM-RC1]
MAYSSSTARIYFNGNQELQFTASYSSHPSLYFPIAGSFKGRIRAVQIFRKTLTLSEINALDYTPLTVSSIHGNGKLSLVHSEVQLSSTKFDFKTISLSSSTLQSSDVILDNLKTLVLFDSLANLTVDSKINSDSLHITLNSSELYFDDSVDISSSNVSVVAINSRFQNDVILANLHILDLSFSTFESVSSTKTIVAYFSCFHCQILGSSPLSVEKYSEINSGNFSSSLIVQESVDNSSITGRIQLANSFDFFSHVILDDVSVSEFQPSSNRSITCHSDVLMKNDVSISKVSLIYYDTLTLNDSTLLFDPCFVILDYQIITGFGAITTNTSNFGKIKPSSNFTFEDNLSLSSSSIVSLQINNDYSSTQLIIGSTAYLDGILELELGTKYDSTGNNYTLIEAGLINGRFSSINPCASLITTFYSETSLIVSVNDFVVDLNQTSYISPSGNDDPCCGTFDSPCASFRGVLERMGRKGKVYFHSGNYTFDQGLGKVNDVDWEVIGLGDLIIEGVDVPLFEIVHSNLSVSNIDIFVIPPIVFLYRIQLSNLSIQVLLMMLFFPPLLFPLMRLIN